MAGVNESDIQDHKQMVANASVLSAEGIAKHDEALAYLMSKGFSHDYSTELLRKGGADTILAEKAAAVITASADESAS
jgi:hypothetical protein